MCDVLLVDGDHTRCGAHADIINMRQLSKTGTILLIDDLNEGPGAALWRVERDRLVEVLELRQCLTLLLTEPRLSLREQRATCKDPSNC